MTIASASNHNFPSALPAGVNSSRVRQDIGALAKARFDGNSDQVRQAAATLNRDTPSAAPVARPTSSGLAQPTTVAAPAPVVRNNHENNRNASAVGSAGFARSYPRTPAPKGSLLSVRL